MSVRTDPCSLTRNGRRGSWRAVLGEDRGASDIVDRVWGFAIAGTRLRKSEEQWSVASGQWSVRLVSPVGHLDTGQQQKLKSVRYFLPGWAPPWPENKL